MTLNILFAAGQDRWPVYKEALQEAIAAKGIKAHVAVDIAPEEVDYIVYAPDSDVRDFTPFTRAKAVLNLWAGVEKIIGNPTLHLPLARMVDTSLTQGMVEWVCGHVLRYHLEMDQHIHNPEQNWAPSAPPLAWERSVVIFGLGELGSACARALAQLGFQVAGWSRTEKEVEQVTCLHGEAGFEAALGRAEIAVLLLPDTPATNDIMDATAFSKMPQGARIINPGRGPLIKDDALLAALDTGRIAHATLDTFRIEPLPADHPFWSHPKITVTPHIASETRAEYSSHTIAENIHRGETGAPFLYLVDRSAGY